MLKRLLVVAFGLLISTGCSAADEPGKAADRKWELGSDYQLIDPPVPTSTGDKVEIVEVFSYACPHCAHFQPFMDELKSKLPSNAQIVLVPAVFNPSWEPFARAFYTAQSLGLVDKTHQAMFDALHRDRLPLNSMDAIADFYAKYGADKGNFLSTSTSFVIEGKLQHGNELVRGYGVEATPTLVVNGKYRITM
ncbi:MAG TPA: thiol:disulfide interchange protein DsbA/DsbL, partial [Rudaea sp.]